MASKIQIRRGTAAQWTAANPILIIGELGFETDTNLIKAGDGTTAWTGLGYFTGTPGVAAAGTLTGATLASNVLASSLTSVGTLANLTVTNTIVGSVNGNAATATTATTVTTNANLTGHITSTGNAAVLGSFTSSQLATALTDETGSGAAVFATSPTLVTPALGTPSALVGTNISGTGVSFTAGTATNATNVAITSDNTATSYFIPFLSAATGNLGLKADAGTGANGLTYMPSTSVLTTGTISANVYTTSISGDAAMSIAPIGSVTIEPNDGSAIIAPTTSLISGGTSPSLTVGYLDNAADFVTIAGGDLYLSTKTDDTTVTPVNIIFEGATANNFETTLTVTDPTADRTITLPDATGTVALTTDLSQFAATSSAQLAGIMSDETGSGALVFATSPVLTTPNLGTPSALVGTNITGTASGFTAGAVTNAGLTGEVTTSGLTATLTNSAVIGKVLTGYTSGAGVVAATDTILQAIQKLNGNAGGGGSDAGTLTGATLAANVLASSLTSVGTLANLTVTNTISGSINGNAATATQLLNTRTIALGGEAAGSTSFDGSANVTITTTIPLLDGGNY